MSYMRCLSCIMSKIHDSHHLRYLLRACLGSNLRYSLEAIGPTKEPWFGTNGWLGTHADLTTMTKRAALKGALLLTLLHRFPETSIGTTIEDTSDYQSCKASPSTCTSLCVPMRDDPTVGESCTRLKALMINRPTFASVHAAGKVECTRTPIRVCTCEVAIRRAVGLHACF